MLTYVGPHDDKQVAAALRRELLRDGQAFYIHNRVSTIDAGGRPGAGSWCPRRGSWSRTARCPRSSWNAPSRGSGTASTTSWSAPRSSRPGLDISNANTLIVERADTFGLSQLHQLRGRVGRSRERGYAYFLYPPEVPLTETAYDRLATIAQNNELGAGMAVAMKDLEIRGAGNVLGVEQSGHVAGVGFDLYVRLVGEAVEAYRAAAATARPSPRSRNRRMSASTCRSTPTCHRTTSAVTGCGWRPTAGWPPPPTTRRIGCGRRGTDRPLRAAARARPAAGGGGAAAAAVPRVRRHRGRLPTRTSTRAGVAADAAGLRATAAQADVSRRRATGRRPRPCRCRSRGRAAGSARRGSVTWTWSQMVADLLLALDGKPHERG